MAACTDTPLGFHNLNSPTLFGNTNIMSFSDHHHEEAVATVHLSHEMSVLEVNFLFVAAHEMTHPDPEVRDGPLPITVSKVDCVASQPLQYSQPVDASASSTSDCSSSVSSSLPSSPIFLRQEEPKSRPLPAFASVSVLKESEETLLGMGLKKDKDGTFKVSSMKPGCLLSDTPIQVGDTLVSINNRSCSNKTGSSVASLLKSTTGWLTITVEHPNGDPMLVESMIRKETPTSKTGLGVANSSRNHRVKVSSVNPTSAFAPSLLGPRDTILSINGHNCKYMTAEDIAKIIAEAKDNVAVVAEKDHDNAAIVTF